MNTGNKTKELDHQTARVMHQDANDWLSEMEFMDDEMAFFAEMLRNYFLALAVKDFEQEKLLLKERKIIANEIILMKQRVTEHHDHLITLVDSAHPEAKERALESEHFEVARAVRKVRKEFMDYKKSLFKEVSEVIKEQKQKSLTP